VSAGYGWFTWSGGGRWASYDRLNGWLVSLPPLDILAADAIASKGLRHDWLCDMTGFADVTDPARPDRMLLGGAVVHLRDSGEVETAIRDRLGSQRTTRPLALASANLDHIHHFGTRRSGLVRPETHHDDLEWWVLLDGVPLVRQANRITGRTWPQLAGSDLLPRVLDIADSAEATVGFLGGSSDTHRILGEVLSQRSPGLKVTGWWSPPRAELTDPAGAAALAGAVAAAKVDLLVVGLGKPRQELWIKNHGAASGARVLVAFGAAIDFLAGTATRAPAWMRRAGSEWAYRFAREPRRLARRYFVQGPSAMWRLWTDSRIVGAAERGAAR
jgi:exopolysaccharide biosynthesis WecB/TagA/CpsF family protein